MPNRQEHSEIWKHFKKCITDVCKATCKYCKSDISRGGKNAQGKGFTTTNMWSHMRRCHPEKLIPVSQPSDGPSTTSTLRQPTLNETLELANMYSPDDPRAIEISKYILEEICVDQEPLDHVNKPGFRRTLKKVCPKYNMISRTHLTDTMFPKMYDDVKSRVMSLLNKLLYISLTSDIWTSGSSSHLNDFISFTAHGLDESFKQQSFCLEMMPFQGETHSGENIAENMHMVIMDWEISDKLIAIVTDNARNMTCAVNDVNSIMPNEIIHVSCNAHTLQLVLVHGLLERESVKELVSVARKIVGHFSHSTVSMKSLQKEQVELGVPEHVLIQDVSTRWDSTYQMLERLKEQRAAIQAVLPKINCQHDLSSQQWSQINNIVQILGYFYQATKSFSNADITLADAIPIINSIFRVLEQSCNNQDLPHGIRGMAQDLMTEMERRFGDLERRNHYILATALDPRYKARVFRRRTTTGMVHDLLCKEVNNLMNTSHTDIQDTAELTPEQTEPSTSKATLWNVCKNIISDQENDEPLSNFTLGNAMDEVSKYLKNQNIDMNADFTKYWSITYDYPNIKKIAWKYLSMKYSSVASEQLFSTAGSIHTDKRNKLTGNNLKMLCF